MFADFHEQFTEYACWPQDPLELFRYIFSFPKYYMFTIFVFCLTVNGYLMNNLCHFFTVPPELKAVGISLISFTFSEIQLIQFTIF